MAWTRIDDKFLNNIKIQKAGVLGMALYLAGLIHCNINLTDGLIDEDILPVLFGLSFQTARNKSVDKLIRLKLWREVRGGYMVNDFLDFNKSKQEIELINKVRAKSGAKGGRPAKQTETNLVSTLVSKETNLVSNLVSKVEPLIPNPLTLIPNPLKELKESTAEAFSGKNADIYASFEAIAPVDERLRTALDSAVNIYSSGWVRDAIAEGVSHNAHTFGYMNKVLESWKKNGRNGNGRKPAKQAGHSLDEWRKYADDQKASEG